MKRGILCLSIDVEGIWGRIHLSNVDSYVPYVRKERANAVNILRVLDRYHMRATWAIVGQLFATYRTLIWMLKEQDQEIASHSFSHVNFANVSRFVAEEEIVNCVKAAKNQGIRLSTFIFPFNGVNHLDVLKRYTFTAFRGSTSPALGFLFPRAHSVQKEAGLCNVTGSMYFPSNRALGKFIPKGWRCIQAKRGIDQAVQTGKVFHLWTHPIDLCDPGLFAEFEHILYYASTRIPVRPMCDL